MCIVVAINWLLHQFQTYAIPKGSLSLTTPYATYLVGEPITFTVTNNYNAPIYLPNECPHEPLSVYRYTNNTWQRQHATSNQKDCPATGTQIKVLPGSSQSGNYNAWQTLFSQLGKYRIVAYVDYFNSTSYQDFEVIAKPEKQKQYAEAPARTIPTGGTTSKSSPITIPQTSPTQPKPTPPAPIAQNYSVTIAAGSIQATYTTTAITITSVVPASGCTYEGSRPGTTASFIEITLKCAGNETQVQLSLVAGNIVKKIE